MPEVVCVGRAVADLFVPGLRNLPAHEELVRVNGCRWRPGGDALNVATNLARLGVSVGLVSLVGDDPAGAFLRDEVRAAGVDVTRVRVRPGVGTATALILDDGAGRHGFVYDGGAADCFVCEDVDLEYVRAARVLYLGDTFLMPRMDGGGSRRLLNALAPDEPCVVMDCNSSADGRWTAVMNSLLARADVFLPSLGEARGLTGANDPEAALSKLMEYSHLRIAGIKLGSDGARLTRRGESPIVVPAIPPARLVDTTGAGDAFLAGFIYGLREGWPLAECGRFAAACGSLTCEVAGAASPALSLAAARKRAEMPAMATRPSKQKDR